MSATQLAIEFERIIDQAMRSAFPPDCRECGRSFARMDHLRPDITEAVYRAVTEALAKANELVEKPQAHPSNVESPHACTVARDWLRKHLRELQEDVSREGRLATLNARKVKA